MTQTLEIPTSTAAQPLPWRWFEFRQPPVPFARSHLAQPFNPDQVFSLELDSHAIPFKVFRQTPTNGIPRPVLFMFHGMGLTIATFRHIAHYLLPTHDLVLPDYSGFSQETSSLPDHASFKAFSLAAWRIADALGIDRMSFAGNSLGGGLSLTAALLALDRVDRLLLSNPACFPQLLPQMYRVARTPLIGEFFMLITPPERFIDGVEYIGYVDKSRFDPVLKNLYIANLASSRNRRRIMQIMRQLPADSGDIAAATHLPQLKEITRPVLISWGMQDPLLTEGSGHRLAALLPNVTFEAYPDLAHMPHEEAPDRVGPRWAAFLNQK